MTIRDFTTVIIGLIFTVTAHADCTQDPANAVPNCGFEDAPFDNHWSMIQGTAGASASATARSGSASFPASGNVPLNIAWLQSDCFPIQAVSDFGFGFYGQLQSGNPVTSCQVTLFQFDDNACTSGVGGTPQSPATTIPTGSWAHMEQVADLSGSSATHGYLLATCESNNSFTVLMDDFYAGPGLTPVSLQSFSID